MLRPSKEGLEKVVKGTAVKFLVLGTPVWRAIEYVSGGGSSYKFKKPPRRRLHYKEKVY